MQLNCKTRDGISGLWAAGDHLNGYLEHVERNLRLLGWPKPRDFALVTSDLEAPLHESIPCNEWAIRLRELRSRLIGWHEAKNAAIAADSMPFQKILLDDERQPLIDRRSTAIRKAINELGGWLHFTAPTTFRGEAKDVDLPVLLSTIKNGGRLV